MDGEKMKHEYLAALEIPFGLISKTGSFRPLKLLFGKRVYHAGKNLKFYGTLLDYIRFCRLNKFEVQITGEEF